MDPKHANAEALHYLSLALSDTTASVTLTLNGEKRMFTKQQLLLEPIKMDSENPDLFRELCSTLDCATATVEILLRTGERKLLTKQQLLLIDAIRMDSQNAKA